MTDMSSHLLQPVNLLPVSAEQPDAEAVWTRSGTLTWAQLEERSRRFANALRSNGIEPEDRWALLSQNSLETAEMALGSLRAGTRSVFLNWHLTEVELADLLNDAQARLLIVSTELEPLGRRLADAVGITQVKVVGSTSPADSYEDWLMAHSDGVLPDIQMGSPLLYTGGTTGKSKGVTRSDSAIPVSAWAARTAPVARLHHRPSPGRTLITTPLYHALGLLVGLMGGIVNGHSISIVTKFDPEETLALIEQRRITGLPMVPTQFVKLLKLPDDIRANYDVSTIDWIFHTAAPCPDWAKRGMIDWFGPVVIELYGSSEGTGPVIATSADSLAKPGTVGKAAGGLVLSIVDDNGNDLPPGEIGTIYVKRADGAPVYEGDPEKTASIRLPDGRFTVGDIGWLDSDGYLFLADRRVDLILVGGSNVYPAEIEGVLSSFPDVSDVAVFGIPHPEFGQEVKAVVEPMPGTTIDLVALDRYARERLASYKIPKTYDITEALPREAHGKLKKRVLRDPYWSAT